MDVYEHTEVESLHFASTMGGSSLVRAVVVAHGGGGGGTRRHVITAKHVVVATNAYSTFARKRTRTLPDPHAMRQ